MGVSVYESLARELEEDPVKCEALRALLLSKELLALPATVVALAAEIKQLGAEVKQLTELMRQSMLRLDHLETDVATLKTDVAGLKGWAFEARWQRYLPSYLGRHFRRLRVLNLADVRILLEDGIDAGRITIDEAYDAGLADVVARGRRGDGTQLYVVVEVSVAVDKHDLDRALRRAVILARATGDVVQPVAAGDRLGRGLQEGESVRGDVLVVVGDREAA